MFEPENELERLLMRAARESSPREAFERALIDAQVITALFGETPETPLTMPSTTIIPEGTILHARGVERNGRSFIPFFSAPGRIWAMTRDSHVAAPDTVRELFQRHPGAYFILNPGSDYGKEFLPQDVTSLLAGNFGAPASGPRIETSTEVLIGSPADYPHDFVKKLKGACETLPEVAQASLSWAQFGAQPPNLLLEFVCSGPREAVMAKLDPLINAARPPERIVDVAIRGDVGDVLSKGIVEPFYVKKRAGFLNWFTGR